MSSQTQTATPLTPVLPTPSGKALYWHQLMGSSASLAVNSLAESNKALLIVCSEAQHMHRLERELRFFGNEQHTFYHFSDWECLAYDKFSPHKDIISERLLTLYSLPQLKSGIVLTTASALMQRLAPIEYVQGNAINLSVGDQLNIEVFTKQLINAGYYSVEQVMSPGEYAVRGGIVDVFPSGMVTPFRLDLFDTEIENIKLFDPETQRSQETINTIRLLPAKEFPLDQGGIDLFRQQFREQFDGDPQKSVIYPQVTRGLAPAGSEYYLPLFFKHTHTLFDYLPDDITLVLADGVSEKLDALQLENQQRYEDAVLDPEWPALPPAQLFIQANEIRQKVKAYATVNLLGLNLKGEKELITFNCVEPTKFNIQPTQEAPYQSFIDYLQRSDNNILLATESAGRREAMLDLLNTHHIHPKIIDSWNEFANSQIKLAIAIADLDHGLKLPNQSLEIITESQLYGERVLQRRRRSEKNRDPDTIIRSLAELKVGDPIVHEDHGIGRYAGMETHKVGDIDNELLVIEYQGGDKLFIPVLSLETISRFIGGDPETAPLHKLGTDTWSKAKQKAQEKAYDVAAELLEVQALRMARKGYAFTPPDHGYSAFSAGFQFEETPDQLNVIDDVINDMTSDKPMDRLVCGDVGFGKTEIAMRACYMGIADQKQVVLLVPTTLLAQQHYQTLCDRFADWPVKIELLSRFRTTKQNDDAIAGLQSGHVDIVVGTHRLLQNDIEFKQLGLMIIDEEHRFGVRQKERLKQLRSQVDILTLTATPIPRTLNIALSGMRDISVIATPPKARLAVKTFVRQWNDTIIKEACLREIRRGGQVYFLHNEVQTIEKMREQLQELIPEAQIEFAHGQMRERQLETIMRDFYHQRFNILLCTTIVESGIDIPSANTIIINKADRFGLAQLHQLRGRVGRSHHQAYAYMLTPNKSALTHDAHKRLNAIASLDDLGAGFALASQDLEIRGAGELLGESQSGLMDQVGYSLFSQFLDQAMTALKRDRDSNSPDIGINASIAANLHTEINLHIPARFPDDYIPDVNLRLTMYKRISNADSADQLYEMQVETIDRFGLLPDAVKNLFTIAKLKLSLNPLGIENIEVGPKGGRVQLTDNPNINIGNLMQLMARRPSEFSMKGSNSFTVRRDMATAEERFTLVEQLIKELS
ncbi:MAG: transcription-repair coupling factor [Arenicella sp.]